MSNLGFYLRVPAPSTATAITGALIYLDSRIPKKV